MSGGKDPNSEITIRQHPPVEFIEVKDTSSEEFKAAMDIYVASFPENERRPVVTIGMDIKTGKCRLIVGRMDAKVVFMALIRPIKETPFVRGDYMAIDEEYRSKGIGALFLKDIFAILNDIDFNYFLGEIENPYLDDDEIKGRRIKFYKKIGMKELKDVRYILPPLQGTLPTEMVLMVLCRTEEKCLKGEDVSGILKRIFRDIYSRSEEDEILAKILEGMPDIIDLI